MGGIVLHQGKIAEMATGEGKTLVAIMPLYLNALPGRGAHLVTVNDYLARRDAQWMGGVLDFLGCTVGYILGAMSPEERRAAYACDVTYGTNNEFGFDYLRDNMVVHPEHRVQREFHYAIVDEVDSVLIDEARTPLIISGRPPRRRPTATTSSRQIVRALRRIADYEVEEDKRRSVAIADGSRIDRVEQKLGLAAGTSLYDAALRTILVHLAGGRGKAKEALQAGQGIHHRQDGEVKIVDEFTGRKMPGDVAGARDSTKRSRPRRG